MSIVAPTSFWCFLNTPPLLPASRFSITPLILVKNSPKTLKNPKIRYKSVITQKSVVKNSLKILIISPPCACVIHVYECMRHSCFTCFTTRWTHVFSTKTVFYRYFILFPVILMSQSTWQYAFLPEIVLRFYCNPSWVIIPPPSCQYLRTNYSCTRFTSRIPISATLDPHNFFLAR